MGKKKPSRSDAEPFRLVFTAEAADAIGRIERENPKKHGKILKTLAFLEADPRHPGLNSHLYQSLSGPEDENVFESYVENQTPGAYRVFWYYGPGNKVITVIAITPHP